MSLIFSVLLLALCVSISECWAQFQFNLTEYKEMPPLYQLEDYDVCVQAMPQHKHGSYCLVYAEIVPNETSALWRRIALYSADGKHHFRHDHLIAGVCLARCKQLLRPLSNLQVKQLYVGKATDQELELYYDAVHQRDSDSNSAERPYYERLINSCLNLEFQRRYALKLRTSIEYCERSDVSRDYDAVELSCHVIIGLIVALNVFCTFYDFRLKRLQPLSCQNNFFYQKVLKSNAQKLLTSFSLCRNYYRLVVPVQRSETAQDLRFFDAFRVIGVFFVILGHTLLIFMTNGTTIIQIFFVMSAFLLYVNVSERQMVTTSTKFRRCVSVYFQVFFYRYFRLVPSLLLLILFNSSLLARLQDGPLWRHITEPERVFCRENWWQNLLFVNNYLLKESCAQQTWYIAADTQLFELFLIILIITKKHPRVTSCVNWLLLLAIFAVPSLLTYFLRLEAVYHLKPETYRYLYFRNTETFYQIYPPFYTNLSGYYFGFLCANLYLKTRNTAQVHKRLQGNWKYEMGIWLLLALALGILLSGYIFIKHDFEKPSIWLALYAGVYKNLWTLISAALVYCMCFKVGWLGYEFCCHWIFRPLASISYQAYLWHVVVLRLLAGHFRQPVYVNNLFMLSNVILAFVLTNLIAFCVALLFEYPVAELMKLLFKPTKAAAAHPKNLCNTIANASEAETRH